MLFKWHTARVTILFDWLELIWLRFIGLNCSVWECLSYISCEAHTIRLHGLPH